MLTQVVEDLLHHPAVHLVVFLDLLHQLGIRRPDPLPPGLRVATLGADHRSLPVHLRVPPRGFDEAMGVKRLGDGFEAQIVGASNGDRLRREHPLVEVEQVQVRPLLGWMPATGRLVPNPFRVRPVEDSWVIDPEAPTEFVQVGSRTARGWCSLRRGVARSPRSRSSKLVRELGIAAVPHGFRPIGWRQDRYPSTD